MASTVTEDRPVASIEAQKAKKFLSRLKDKPFVAVVFEDSRAVIYMKGASEEQINSVKDMLDEIQNQED